MAHQTSQAVGDDTWSRFDRTESGYESGFSVEGDEDEQEQTKGEITREEAKQWVFDFYKKYNPSKLDKVDKFLEVYSDDYQELIYKLEQKYLTNDSEPTSPASPTTKVSGENAPAESFFSPHTLAEFSLDNLYQEKKRYGRQRSHSPALPEEEEYHEPVEEDYDNILKIDPLEVLSDDSFECVGSIGSPVCAPISNPMRRPSAKILSPSLRKVLDSEFDKVEEVLRFPLSDHYDVMSMEWDLDSVNSDDGLVEEEDNLWEYVQFLRAQMTNVDKENVKQERLQTVGKAVGVRGGVLKGSSKRQLTNSKSLQKRNSNDGSMKRRPSRSISSSSGGASFMQKLGGQRRASTTPKQKTKYPKMRLDLSDLTLILPGANQQVIMELQQAIDSETEELSHTESFNSTMDKSSSTEDMVIMNRHVELQEWSEGPHLGDDISLLQEDYSGLVPLDRNLINKNAMIVYAAQMIIRPDAPHNAIILCLEQCLMDLDMQAERPNESGILGIGFPSSRLQDKANLWVDMQICIEKLIKQRVIFVRFCRRGTFAGDFMTGLSGGKADEIKRKNREWARKVLDVTWTGLESSGLVLAQLRDQKIQDCSVESLDIMNMQVLDTQFKRQLEGLCREEMHFSLDQATKNINEYVERAEQMASSLLKLMVSMYVKYGIDAPPMPDTLPPECYQMDELMKAETPFEMNENWFKNSRVDVGQWRPVNELEKMNWVVEMAYKHFGAKYTKEMADEIQKKNLQAMDRLSKLHKFERQLVKTLRDAEEVQNSKTSVIFHEKVQVFVASMASDKEAPIFDCDCAINKSPGTLYLTYWHIWVVSSLAGGAGRWVLKIDYTDIEEVEVQKRRFSLKRSSLNLVTSSQGHITLSPSESCTKLSYLIELLVRLHSEPEDAMELPHRLLKQQSSTSTSSYFRENSYSSK